MKACTAKAASAFLSKSEDATGWRWDVVVASSPEQVVQVQQQAQLAGVKKHVAILLEFRGPSDDVVKDYPNASLTSYPAAKGIRKDIQRWWCVPLSKDMPGAMDFVRRSTFQAPERSLSLLRAAVPKAFLDETVWCNVLADPDDYVKGKLGQLHSTFKWETVAGPGDAKRKGKEIVLQGLLRVPSELVEGILAVSGKGAVFVSKLAKDSPSGAVD